MSGQLWFTQRLTGGQWEQLWENPDELTDNNPGPFADASGVFNNNLPDVVGIAGGGLWIIRRENKVGSDQGDWSPHFDEIQRFERNNPGDFQVVSSASEMSRVQGRVDSLHVVGIVKGRLWHTLRSGQGWQPF